MAIRILTDSTADFSLAEAARERIEIVPLRVLFENESYCDRVDISVDEFYKRLLESKRLPTTSQPTPADFIPHFEAAKKAGDDLIVLVLSKELSGTWQSALIARSMVEYERIYIIDTAQVTLGLRLLAEEANRLKAGGKTAEQIVSEIETLKNKVSLKAIVGTLDYLVKGGRLSKTAGFAGSLLSIKPLITIKDGRLEVLTKGRGKKGALDALWRKIEKDPADLSKPMLLGYTYEKDSVLELKEFLNAKGIPAKRIAQIGSVIGTHAGPQAYGIAYFLK